MNVYKISDISVGMKESFKRTITAEMMQRFMEITADENPLHVDESYAKSKGFPNRVAYGMLTASFISTLGGCYIPGKYCLIRGVEIKFAKPVYIGDELTILGEISRVDAGLKYLEVKVTIWNQKNEKVLRGLLKAGVMDE
jgi:3-hydroxybutyryl-CoA dehydratase